MAGNSPLIFVLLGLIILALLVFLVVNAIRGKSGRETSAKRQKSKSREQLLKEANKRLVANPKDPTALVILADVYFNDGLWEKAMMAYGSIIEGIGSNSSVDEVEANMRHGICAMNLKRYEEAYHSLSVARALKPEIFEINFNLGTIEYNRKNYEKAIILLGAANEKQPDHMEVRKFLGMSFFRLKRYKEAIDKLKGVIDQQMDDKEAIYYLAHSYFENGQLDMSVQLFSHLRPDPAFGPQSSLMAGSIHLKTKQFDEAQIDFEIGLKHKSMKKEVALELRYRLATTLMKKQEIQEALQQLRAIYDIEPNYKDVATQIQRNTELSRNEYLQTYLIGAPSDYVSLCRRICTTFFSKARTKIIDIYVGEGDFSDVLAEVETPSWEDVILFRFIRSTGSIGEFVLRDLYTKSKDLKAGRAFCITAGTFSEGALKFVEARSIDLVDKDGLLKALNKLQRQGE